MIYALQERYQMSKQEDQTLKKLVKAYKTLEEANSYGHDGKGGISPIVPTKGEGKHVEDLRGQGARSTDAEQKSGFEGNPTNPEGTNVTAVARESGASAGAKEVGDSHGKGGAPEGSDVKSVTQETGRDEGSSTAPKDYNQDFRQRIKTALGLPLNDKLNQTGKGLGK